MCDTNKMPDGAELVSCQVTGRWGAVAAVCWDVWPGDRGAVADRLHWTRPLLVLVCSAPHPLRPPDLPEDFYELTTEDLAALAAHKAERAKVCCGWPAGSVTKGEGGGGSSAALVHIVIEAVSHATDVASTPGLNPQAICLTVHTGHTGRTVLLLPPAPAHTHPFLPFPVARPQADAMFRTRAMREAERAAAAAAYGPVRLRLHFPGGLLVQAAFQARDTLAQVKVRGRPVAALARVANEGQSPGSPKTVLPPIPATTQLCICGSVMGDAHNAHLQCIMAGAKPAWHVQLAHCCGCHTPLPLPPPLPPLPPPPPAARHWPLPSPCLGCARGCTCTPRRPRCC